jgi:Fe-S-cluster containining protein
MNYPCKSCGACCRHISSLPALDRGDGICHHYDEATRLCTVYDDRPLVCRIDRYYEVRLREQMPAMTFYAIQAHTCAALDSDNADLPAKVFAELRSMGLDDAGLPRTEDQVHAAIKVAGESLRPQDLVLVSRQVQAPPAGA